MTLAPHEEKVDRITTSNGFFSEVFTYRNKMNANSVMLNSSRTYAGNGVAVYIERVMKARKSFR